MAGKRLYVAWAALLFPLLAALALQEESTERASGVGMWMGALWEGLSGAACVLVIVSGEDIERAHQDAQLRWRRILK